MLAILDGLPAAAFLARLKSGEPGEVGPFPTVQGPALATLVRGDLELPAGSEVYALFAGAITGGTAASDWIG